MWKKHKIYWPQKIFIYNVLIGAIFIIIALFANQYANSYIVAHASNLRNGHFFG